MASTDSILDPHVQQKFELIRSVGEECVTEAELRNLVEKKPNFRLYDGFEPSGRMHIAQGVFKAMNVNKCTQAGGQFVFWVADWFALMNDKMGGDLDKIKTVGNYLIEVWKATGMDMEKVQFVWSSEEINKNPKVYWLQALDVARRFTVARLTKCCQIMGRKEGSLTAAQILYPLMQCTDVFFLKADICQLGVDQRKVNMLARDYCDAAGRKLKPVILSHHMLYGLKKGQEKMSKSDADSAIFMEDSAEDVARKIRQAYCPMRAEGGGAAAEEGEGLHLVEDLLKNPCLDYVQHIIFASPAATFGAGGTTYPSFEAVKAAFLAGELSEGALKEGLIEAVNELLAPVRRHFDADPTAKALLETIKEWKQAGVLAAGAAPPPPEAPPAPTTVVYCPLPRDPATFLSLASAHQTLRQLESAPPDHRVVLFLADWGAFVCNCLTAEEPALRAAFTLYVHLLRVLRPTLMAKVQVVWQSDTILAAPDTYWIAVINVGRAMSLKRVQSVIGGEQEEEAQKVHDVILPLMYVADLLSLRATHVICSPEDEGLPRFGEEYGPLQQRGLRHTAAAHLLPLLKKDGAPGDPECHVSALDPEMEVNSKLKKKAFCEPSNTEFCPPLGIVTAFLLPITGTWRLERKDADGGPKEYQSGAEVVEDFGSGGLHPGDLKTNVARALNDVLAPWRAHLKADPEAKKALGEYDKAVKRLAKGRK